MDGITRLLLRDGAMDLETIRLVAQMAEDKDLPIREAIAACDQRIENLKQRLVEAEKQIAIFRAERDRLEALAPPIQLAEQAV